MLRKETVEFLIQLIGTINVNPTAQDAEESWRKVRSTLEELKGLLAATDK